MTHFSEIVNRGISRQGLLLRKNSPQFLFVGGVVGMVSSTVLACRATLRLQEVLDESQKDLETANKVREGFPERYSHQDRQKDTAIIYIRSGAKVAKLYTPSVILGVASIAALTKSHNILNERNAALTAAYAAVDKAFKEYRERVVEKYGEEEDRQFRYETEIIASEDKKGKPKTSVRVAPGEPSGYARFFDQYSPNWSKEPEYNVYFLKCQQNYANDLLNSRGHVFLNEVYDMLGIDRSEAGAVVGWVRNGEGDNYIDFGVFIPDAPEHVRDFVNGREGSVLLDFNVDGVIYDKIEYKEAPSWQHSDGVIYNNE